MTISGEVPTLLKMAAQTGFLTSAQPAVPLYDPIATTYDMPANSIDLVDIGRLHREVLGPGAGAQGQRDDCEQAAQ
jgi:hypothetical protein